MCGTTLRLLIDGSLKPILLEGDGSVRVTPGEALAAVRRELPRLPIEGRRSGREPGCLGGARRRCARCRVDSTSGKPLGTIKRETG